jgi:hypothetical protein
MRAGAQARSLVDQEVGQQKWRQVIEGECVLQPIGGLVAVGPEPADVVDEHIEPWVRREDVSSEAPDVALRRQIRHEDVHRAVVGLATDRVGRLLGSPPIAAGDTHPSTRLRQPDGGRPADPAGSAGDQHDLADHAAASRSGATPSTATIRPSRIWTIRPRSARAPAVAPRLPSRRARR